MKHKLKIKVGDTVQVRVGKDGPKARPEALSGKVTQVLPEDGLVVVEGVNAAVRHLKSSQRGQKGQRIEYFAPLGISKVMLVCPKCGVPTRVNIVQATGEDGSVQKSRQCKKCQATFA
jgi:large subunit ribosomal protein L24